MNKPTSERMREFVDYHINGDGECNAILLAEYANRNSLTSQERFDLAYFFATVYCCESAIILLKNRDRIRSNTEKTADVLKPEMIFQSDRKYMKMRNCFPRALEFWTERLQNIRADKFINHGIIDLRNAVLEVERWYMFGRFSAFLFLETYATLMNSDVTEYTIDWKNGDTATSGLLNLFGKDVEANEFDARGILRTTPDKLDAWFKKVASRVSSNGGDANATKLETSHCAYRKFYKGSRYNGYYLDRMLEELVWYGKLPKYNRLTAELYSIRKAVFPDEMLGELHGWNGIRKENKKLYQEYGIV